MRILLAVVLAVVLMGGVVFGYTTYKEAYDAGMVKYDAKDYVGARIDFQTALTLTTIGIEKSLAQLCIGHSYHFETKYLQARIEYIKVLAMVDGDSFYKSEAQLFIGHSYHMEKNYEQARVEYTKVLERVDGDSYNKSYAQLNIGHSYNNENNYPQARIEYVKVLEMVDSPPRHKSEALYKIVEIGGDFNIVVMSLSNVKDWSGYFYRAKAKRMLEIPDNAGAKIDIVKAMSLTDDNDNQKTLAEELQRIKLALGEK